MGLFVLIFKIRKEKNKEKKHAKVSEFKAEKLEYENFDSDSQYDFLSKIDKTLHNGLSDDEIKQLSNDCKEQLGSELPEDFKKFLKICNGFYGSGVYVLGKFNEDVKEKSPRASESTFDILTWHEMGWEWTNEYIILGKDSTSFIAYDVVNNKYVIMSNGTSTVFNESDYFSLVFEKILKNNDIIE